MTVEQNETLVEFSITDLLKDQLGIKIESLAHPIKCCVKSNKKVDVEGMVNTIKSCNAEGLRNVNLNLLMSSFLAAHLGLRHIEKTMSEERKARFYEHLNEISNKNIKWMECAVEDIFASFLKLCEDEISLDEVAKLCSKYKADMENVVVVDFQSWGFPKNEASESKIAHFYSLVEQCEKSGNYELLEKHYGPGMKYSMDNISVMDADSNDTSKIMYNALKKVKEGQFLKRAIPVKSGDKVLAEMFVRLIKMKKVKLSARDKSARVHEYLLQKKNREFLEKVSKSENLEAITGSLASLAGQ